MMKQNIYKNYTFMKIKRIIVKENIIFGEKLGL